MPSQIACTSAYPPGLDSVDLTINRTDKDQPMEGNVASVERILST